MTETARTYGGVCMTWRRRKGWRPAFWAKLDEARAFWANPEYLPLLSTPSIPKKERCGLLDEALRGQVHLYVLNFLSLCERAPCGSCRLRRPGYRVRYNQAHGILGARPPPRCR